jgi:hypothetical protein
MLQPNFRWDRREFAQQLSGYEWAIRKVAQAFLPVRFDFLQGMGLRAEWQSFIRERHESAQITNDL